MGLLTAQDKDQIVQAIEAAERRTSGEIRVHVERTSGPEPLERAAEVFERLGMAHTKERNGVLIYLATIDRVFAIIGDLGINEAVPDDFWDEIRNGMEEAFRCGHFTEGICQGIQRAGEALAEYFPYQSDDVNEICNSVSEG